jgi:hypothetical protein
MVVGLFCRIGDPVDKLHRGLEVRELEDALDGGSVSLPPRQGTKCLLNF